MNSARVMRPWHSVTHVELSSDCSATIIQTDVPPLHLGQRSFGCADDTDSMVGHGVISLSRRRPGQCKRNGEFLTTPAVASKAQEAGAVSASLANSRRRRAD